TLRGPSRSRRTICRRSGAARALSISAQCCGCNGSSIASGTRAGARSAPMSFLSYRGAAADATATADESPTTLAGREVHCQQGDKDTRDSEGSMSRQVFLFGVGFSLIALAFTITDYLLTLQPGITEANMKRIQKGMSEEDVKAILGRAPDPFYD